jgi:hypothetical protein
MSKFKTLWNNYPDKRLLSSKCFNKQKDSSKPFSDYCAIMLSECLIKSGISISAYKGNKCWSHSVGLKHILLAEDLANGLKASPPRDFKKMIEVNPKTFQKDLADKTGIIFFKDYWPRGNESEQTRSGDHIDLWDKDKITSSSMFFRSVYEFVGTLSDLNRSRKIWFWEVK